MKARETYFGAAEKSFRTTVSRCSYAATVAPDARIFIWTLKTNLFFAIVSESVLHVRIHDARALEEKK